ncbi:MAG: hypothetical protein AAGA71_11475 [Pseudomonadota bacterium]
MAGDQNYRDKSQNARRAARAHLKQLRAQRRAKRSESPEPWADAAPQAEEGRFVVDSSLLFSPAEGAEEPIVEDVPDSEPEVAEAAEVAEVAAVDDATPVEDASAEATPAVEEVANDALPEPQPPEVAPPTAAEVATTPAPPNPPRPVDIDSELLDLPCAGEGMVWLFQQCGITSMADLAQADAENLSQQLGIVGYILDITPWIEFARERQPTP